MAKLLFGCGYLGSRVARRWLDAGENVVVVTRSEDRAGRLTEQGITAIVADVTRPESLGPLPEADTVLFAVGFDRTAGPSMRDVYVDGLRNVFNALPSFTGRLIHISSTGVYGQTDGGWVDEDSPCRPIREGGQVSLEAEETLRRHPLGRRAVVLRLAGIYGPRRLPRMENVVSGQPVPAAPAGYLNLIHVDDAASAVIAAETCTVAGQNIIVCDGHPVPRREFYEELARQLNAPPPRFVDPPAGSTTASRSAADKRIRNRRMLELLHFKLTFPSYRQGLASVIAAEA